MSLARTLPLALALFLAAATGVASAQDPAPATPQALLDASQPSDWRTPDPDNVLYMDLPGGRVVIDAGDCR